MFEDLNWIEGLPRDYLVNLKALTLKILSRSPLNRQNLWLKIILNKFMRFQKKDFNILIRDMIKNHELNFKDIKGTGKLNELSIISINDKVHDGTIKNRMD